MGGIKIGDAGLRFVDMCLRIFNADSGFLLCFGLALLYIVIFVKKERRNFIILYLVILGLTVFNPLVVRMVLSKVDMSVVYYRFFWLLPIVPVLAYAFTEIIMSQKEKRIKGVLAVILILLILNAGTAMFNENNSRTTNKYKIPNDLIEVVRIIHEDSVDENPSVIFDLDYMLLARQYDASLLLPINRDVALDLLGGSGDGITEEYKETEIYKMQKIIVDVTMADEQCDALQFKIACDSLGVDYFVQPNEMNACKLIEEIGGQEIGRIGNLSIYRYN